MIHLETDRLLLRPFQEWDLATFVAYRSDPDVARYQSWETPYTMQQARVMLSSLERFRSDLDAWHQVAIELRATGEMAGDCAFCILSQTSDEAEIGFTLAAAHQGKGYAVEAVGALIAYLFTHHGLNRVRANCDVENERSLHLLRRLGMEPEGPPERVWFKERWSLEQWHVLAREKWACARQSGDPPCWSGYPCS